MLNVRLRLKYADLMNACRGSFESEFMKEVRGALQSIELVWVIQSVETLYARYELFKYR